MIFASTPCPEATPWGAPQTRDQLLPGIWHVTTAGHGGMLLSDERQRAMPEVLRSADAAYEEDIDWAAVYLAFETEFRTASKPRIEIHLQLAHDTIKAWRPHDYAAFTGETVTLQDSHVLQKIAAYEKAIGQYAVVAAYGAWADWVPEGKVGVHAKRVTGVTHLGFGLYDESDCIHALCDATRYDSARLVNTVEDLEAVPC